MPSYYDLVQEQKGQPVGVTQADVRSNQSELDKRMQADAELLRLDSYVLKDVDGKAVPDIVNITLNRPAVFAANVIAALCNTRQQVIVESEDKKVDTHLIEDFLNAAISAADRRLWRRGLLTLNAAADEQLCLRGRAARRVLLRLDEDGELVSDITWWDGRYVYYEEGEEGLRWAAYETIRTRDELEAEYGERAAEALAKALVTNRVECSALDVWDDEVNEVWVNGEKVWEQANPYGFCPVTFQKVSLGYSSLRDRNWAKHDGESIFFMIRDIVPEMNRLASILQTLNMNQLKAPLQYQNADGTPQDEPPDRPEMGDVVSVGKGALSQINLGDARASAQMLYNIMEKAFQEGSYTDIDIGNVQQPFSAVALITIGETKDLVYMPRLAAKELLNKATAEMLIQQAIMLGDPIELGLPGHKREFPVARLEGEYDISYKYFVRSPKIDIARMSLAEAAARWYPRRHIYETVLQVEDPDGMEREWYIEEAEKLSPGVKQHRIITALLEQAERNNDADAATQARILAMELGVNIERLKQGIMPRPQAPQPVRGQETGIPLMPPGGRVGGIGPPISRPQLAPPAAPVKEAV